MGDRTKNVIVGWLCFLATVGTLVLIGYAPMPR